MSCFQMYFLITLLVMNLNEILSKQFFRNGKSFKKRNVYIIKKDHLQLEYQHGSEISSKIPNIRIQIRSKSERKANSREKMLNERKDLTYDVPLSSKIEPAHMQSIKSERSQIRKKYKSVQNKQRTVTPQLSTQVVKQKKQHNHRSYLDYIRASKDEEYYIKSNFQQLRRRNRKFGINQNEKMLAIQLSNMFTFIYENILNFSSKSKKIIQQTCRMFLQNQEKSIIEIILAIYYPKILHTKIRPFLVYQRQICYYVYILTISKTRQKCSLAQLDSIRLSLKYIRECLEVLIEPIVQMEEQVISRINQTFRILKAVGEVEKKITVIQRQILKMSIRANKSLLDIQTSFLQLLHQKHSWQLQKLYEVQMALSWKYLKIPPVPYLPNNFLKKPYTLILELNKTLIFYDSVNKTLKYRPFIDVFMNSLKENFQIVLYSIDSKEYIQTIVNQIQKTIPYFDYILCDSHLVYYNSKLKKDFKRLGRDKKKSIIIDHQMQNWKDINGNSLQISVWSGDKSDKQLYSLAKLLLNINKEDPADVQQYIKKRHSYLQMVDEKRQDQQSSTN